ncbi:MULTISPECIES: hypothetical protein [Sphingomonas]
MRDDVMPDDALEKLAKMLRSTHLPVQTTIANAIGADQPFVSRVLRGEVKRVTPRVERLWKYASSRIAEAERASEAVADVERELTSDYAGTEDIQPARRSGRKRRTNLELVSETFAADALSGVKAYLEDGYDPRLIVEQLVVLRRAQQVRRAGRAPGKRG